MTWGEKLVFSGTRDDSLPPKVLAALDAYLAESNSKLLVVMPLRRARKRQEAAALRVAHGVLRAARRAAAIDRPTRRGRPPSTPLYNAVEHRRIPFRWVWAPIARSRKASAAQPVPSCWPAASP